MEQISLFEMKNVPSWTLTYRKSPNKHANIAATIS